MCWLCVGPQRLTHNHLVEGSTPSGPTISHQGLTQTQPAPSIPLWCPRARSGRLDRAPSRSVAKPPPLGGRRPRNACGSHVERMPHLCAQTAKHAMSVMSRIIERPLLSVVLPSLQTAQTEGRFEPAITSMTPRKRGRPPRSAWLAGPPRIGASEGPIPSRASTPRTPVAAKRHGSFGERLRAVYTPQKKEGSAVVPSTEYSMKIISKKMSIVNPPWIARSQA